MSGSNNLSHSFGQKHIVSLARQTSSSSSDSNKSTNDEKHIRIRRSLAAITTCASIGIGMLFLQPESPSLLNNIRAFHQTRKSPLPFPAKELFLEGKSHPYNVSADFRNGAGMVPPYWDHVYRQFVVSNNTNSSSSNNNEMNVYFNQEGELQPHQDIFWGPCYSPDPSQSARHPIQWDKEIAHKYPPSQKLPYPKIRTTLNGHKDNYNNSDIVEVPFGLCRPGFLIIGAGKCGTSSLYHYLVGHPRVLPARKKQIHYFKYHPKESMEWYLSHFPQVKTFLSQGALLTGEASPGYLPYPDVVKRTATRLKGDPRIIIIAREPLDRAWSSYKYNYVEPALKILKNKGMKGIVEPKLSEEYYRKHHLFSFEDFIRTELKRLRKCLKPGGFGETKTRKKYGDVPIYKDEFNRRDLDGDLDPLIAMDDYCYGDRVNKTVPRAQWAELMAAHPDKILDTPTILLTQSIVGRGLYTLPLEWWYAAFPAEHIYMFCTEDLKDRPAGSMSDLSDFLGLPSFNFTRVVSKGMYNVGGNEGYDKRTSWTAVEDMHESESLFLHDDESSHNSSDDGYIRLVESGEEIPISAELREEFLKFVTPYNERLFKLTGKRCPWD